MPGETELRRLRCVVRRKPAPRLQPRQRRDEHDGAAVVHQRQCRLQRQEMRSDVDGERRVPVAGRRVHQPSAEADADVEDDTVEAAERGVRFGDRPRTSVGIGRVGLEGVRGPALGTRECGGLLGRCEIDVGHGDGRAGTHRRDRDRPTVAGRRIGLG
jgi:hypothetical protein